MCIRDRSMAGVGPEPEVLELLGHLDVAPCPPQALLPQRVEAARLLGPHHGMGLEDDPSPRELGLERGERVLGQRRGVDATPDGLDVDPAVELGAARQAGQHAEHVLAPTCGGLCGDVFVADEPGHVVGRPTPLLDVGGHRTDLGIGQLPGHLLERRRLVDDVGVHHQEGLHPVVLQQDGQTVVEGVGLALAALLAAHVHHVARVLGNLGLDDLRGVVGAGVVDHADAQPVTWVVEEHEPIDGRTDDGLLVPRRDEDGGAGEVVADPAVVVVPRVEGHQQELVESRQERDDPDHDEQHEEPLAAEGDPVEEDHGAAASSSAPTFVRTRAYRPTESQWWLSLPATRWTPRRARPSTRRGPGQPHFSLTSTSAPVARAPAARWYSSVSLTSESSSPSLGRRLKGWATTGRSTRCMAATVASTRVAVTSPGRNSPVRRPAATTAGATGPESEGNWWSAMSTWSTR